MPALKDVWVVGDEFLYDTFTTFQAKKVEAEMDNVDRPFLHEYYNVKFLFKRPLSEIRSFEARVINSLIDGLNTSLKRLPKYIIFVLDKDIIESNLRRIQGYGIRSMMQASIEYLMKEANKLISRRKDDMKQRRGGSISSSAEPRIMWTTIIKRPFNTQYSMHEIYKIVSKANTVIEEAVRKFNKYNHLIYIETVNLHFDTMGKLSAAGRTAFWKEIVTEMEIYDRGKTNLEPKKINTTTNSYHDYTCQRFKDSRLYHHGKRK